MSICEPCRKGGDISRTAVAETVRADIRGKLQTMSRAEHRHCPELRRQADPTLADLVKAASALCDCQHEMAQLGTSGRA